MGETIRGQIGQIIAILLEFIIAFLLITAVGPTLYTMCANIPLGFILQLFLPGPEDAVFGVLKALVDAGLLTAGSAAAVFR